LKRRAAAIQWESQAVRLDPGDKDIRENLEKMIKGKKTW
jgi:hypothetical protein